MKLYFLGTCAGTEPMPDRTHTSFALESGGSIYWFDAGEGCSYSFCIEAEGKKLVYSGDIKTTPSWIPSSVTAATVSSSKQVISASMMYTHTLRKDPLGKYSLPTTAERS